MTDRPKIPVVVRRRPPAEASKESAASEARKEGPEPSGTQTIPTPVRGVARPPMDTGERPRPRLGEAPWDRGPKRDFRRDDRGRRPYHVPNAITAPREPITGRDPALTPSRPIMRDAPVVAPSVRTFGSSRRKKRCERESRLRPIRAVREVKPPTPPKPRPPLEVFPIDELTIKVLRAVVESTARNAQLPQAKSDPEFVPGATYRDIRRILALSWPDVRDAVLRARPHQVLKVGRFYGRFGPVFLVSDYGARVLAAADAGEPIPEPPPEIAEALERMREARARWEAEHE